MVSVPDPLVYGEMSFSSRNDRELLPVLFKEDGWLALGGRRGGNFDSRGQLLSQSQRFLAVSAPTKPRIIRLLCVSWILALSRLIHQVDGALRRRWLNRKLSEGTPSPVKDASLLGGLVILL